jgi:hypothetical protein
VELCHWPPWVETQGHEVLEELGLEEEGLVAINVVLEAPGIHGLCKVGAVGVKAFSFGSLNDQSDCRDVLGVADAAHILQLCYLVLIKSLAGGEGGLASRNLWGNCIIMFVPIVVARIFAKAR